MASTYEPIASTTLGSDTATVTFSAIGSDWTDLVIAAHQFQTPGGYAARLQFNSDTGSNYSVTQLRGNGSTATSGRLSSQTYIDLDYTSSSQSTAYTTHLISIQSYASTNVYKTMLSRSGRAGGGVDLAVGLWRSTAAITSVSLLISGGGAFKTGSTFSLYGIKAA